MHVAFLCSAQDDACACRPTRSTCCRHVRSDACTGRVRPSSKLRCCTLAMSMPTARALQVPHSRSEEAVPAELRACAAPLRGPDRSELRYAPCAHTALLIACARLIAAVLCDGLDFKMSARSQSGVKLLFLCQTHGAFEDPLLQSGGRTVSMPRTITSRAARSCTMCCPVQPWCRYIIKHTVRCRLHPSWPRMHGASAAAGMMPAHARLRWLPKQSRLRWVYG